MKKSIFRISVVFILSLTFTFISCDGCYQSSFDDSQLRAKNTIKTFDHLNAPIVIALPVYDTLYKFGNTNMDSKKQRLGDIIAVIDIESDTVFDWIYYPGAHGWSIWRLVEVSENPVRYLMSSVGKKEIAMLDPTKTALSVTKTGLDDNLWALRCYGKYAPICIPTATDFEVNLFNVETEKVDKTVPVPTDSIGYISYLRSDSKGDFYFTACLDKAFSLYKIDTEKLSVSESEKKFDMDTFEKDDKEAQSDDYTVLYVSDDWIFLMRNPLGNDTHARRLYLIDKDTLKIEKTINIDNVRDNPLYRLEFLYGNYYAVSWEWRDGDSIALLYKIDIDNMTWEKLDVEIEFDFTENVYSRGTKIYLMNSRNPSDIKYTYYDVSTGETGDVVEVSVQSILDSL